MHREMILSAIEAKPDMSLAEIEEILEAAKGASGGASSMRCPMNRTSNI
ncbi:hypothetical protein [Bradyrhizobium brasilense]|nr:hypothetical protein [Bradyrhizobium brasilense]MCC8969170.1 hypothetical protein [Bradyrhizobium brasilense]